MKDIYFLNNNEVQKGYISKKNIRYISINY